MRTTSDQGIMMIRRFEGLHLESYKDPIGIWTIGWGHTKNVKAGMHISLDEAAEFLLQDLAPAENAVNSYGDFNQNQFDALVSFTFNCGIGNLHKLMRNGERTKAQVADAILLYNKAGGKVLKGLENRRKEERDLFLTPCSQDFSYYPAYEGNSCRIDEVFAEIGATQDYDMKQTKPYLRRKPIAAVNGYSSYIGTYGQNLLLMAKAKFGTLRRP